ncbi:MAG: arginine--tRNA ligase domain-containing protein, partial [Promethearchaeota archaeon]
TARCAVLGDIAARVLRVAGYDVEVANYIDDLGRQVAVMIHGYLNFKDQVEKKVNFKDDYYLGLIYVKGAEDLASRDDGEEIVRKILHEMEEPGSEENLLAKKLVDSALKGQLETLWRMNIYYDLLIWERHIISSGLFDEAIRKMMEKNPKACYKVESGPDKGCIVLNMSEFGEKYTKNKKPYKILTRSNGVSTYTGKDIAFQLWKFGEARGFFKYIPFIKQPGGKMLYTTILEDEGASDSSSLVGSLEFGGASRAINVIGYEQKFPQQVVKAAMKILGFEEHYNNSQHLSFKHVWLPGQKFSGREGTWIGYHADAAMEKSVSKAKDIIKSQNPELSQETQDKLAEIIGVGAIKFYLAKFDLEKEIVINWDALLNFEGDASPYVQYSCVRARSILEKAKERGIEIPGDDLDVDFTLLQTREEKELYFNLAQLPKKIKDTSNTLSINLIIQSALEIADKFNRFYHACPVLRSDVPEALRNARFMLVKDSITVLTNLLQDVIGIGIPERM